MDAEGCEGFENLKAVKTYLRKNILPQANTYEAFASSILFNICVPHKICLSYELVVT